MKTFLLNTGRKINGFLLLLLLLLFYTQNISAQRFAVTTGAWNGAIWATTVNGVAGSAGTPTTGDAVTINFGSTVTVNLAANAASLIVNGTLNVTGANLTIKNGGSVTNNSGGSIVFNATNLINGGGNGANGILIAINSGSSLTTANANGFTSSTGSFQHNLGNRSQTYSPGANFTYNGTIAQNTGTSYPTALTGSLTINNSNGVTLTDAARTITTGTLNLVDGIFNTIPVATNRLSIGSTATINRSGGSIAGTLQGTGVYNLTYTGNSKTSGPEAANTGLNNVTVNLTAAQTLTLDSTVVAPDGNLSVSAGILDLGSNSINRSAAGGTLTVSNGATLKIGGTNTLPLNYNTHSIGSSSTVEYSGTSQTVAVINSSQNYGNLTLSGSGTKTVAGAITASGTTTVNSGVTFATGAAFTANGAVAINGTFLINQGGFGGGSGTWTYGSNTNLIYNYTQTTFYGPVDATHKYWPATSGPTNVTLQMQNNASLDAGELRMGVARTITGALTSNNANGRTMIFNLNGNNFQSASLIVGTTAPLTLLSTAVTTVTGNININADFAINGDLNVGGNWTKSASGITFTRNSKAVFFIGSGTTQTVTITGGGTETFDYLLIDKESAGSVQLGSATNITIAANTANTFEIKTSASSLDLNGNTLNLSASGGNIYANSVAASIIGGSGSKIVVSGGIKNFVNTQPADMGSWTFTTGVTLEASNGVNFGTQTTVNGTFKILSSGFASGNTAPFYANGSTLEISTGGTFSLYDNGGSNESGGWFRNNASTGSAQRGVPWNFTISGNTTVNYNSVADANPRYSNGNIDIQSGSFFTLGGSAGGNLFIRGNFSRGGTFTPNSRLVTFDGTSSQTINNATTFYDLSNTNIASPLILGAIMKVTNNLSIASSAFLNLGSFIHTAGSLTLNGSAQGTGSSYGGTASPAATISAFFTNTTGVVNIGICGNYSLTSTAAAAAICTGDFATINLVNSSPANLPDGTYQLFYTIGAPNAGSGSASMTISGGTGTGSFTTTDSLATSGPTSITIDYIRSGCVSIISANKTATIAVNVVPLGPVIAKVPTDATVCVGLTLTISVTTAGTGGAISPQDEYRFSTDNGSSWSNWGTSLPSFAAVTGTNIVESQRTSTGSGCSTAAGNTVSWTVSNANTWIGGTSTAWNNALNWSCGIVPFPATDVTIGTSTNDPIITSNVAINSLIINLGETLTVNSNYDLAVSDVIANTGTLTIENNSNLLQTNNVANTGSGSTIVKRVSAPIKRLDYTLWSSPVTGQGLYSFSPTTLSNRFYVYNPTLNSYSNTDVGFNLTNLQYPSPLVAPIGINGTDSANIPFVPARGYLIRMPWNHPTAPTVWNGTFTGVPNNGTISMPLTDYGIGKRYNLIGNPYPSAIDVETFIQTNIDNGSITGTVYFWRKTNGALNGSYCTYNLGGFLGNGESILDLPQYGEDFENIVQVGQGFFVERKEVSTGSVVFTNDMRISSNVNRFFKTTNIIERNRIWLNVTNASGSFSQAMIAYITGATQGVDIAIDGKLFTDGAVALASLIGTDAYAIQGRALPFDVSDVVPLSLKVTTAGTYTITIDHVDGLFTNNSQTIYLRDLATGSVHNLNAGGYNFTTDAGTFDTRFEIIYQAASLGTLTFNESQVVIYKTPTNEISINTGNVVMSMVKIFDIRGRLLQEQKNSNASQTAMSVGVANEILLVQITSEEGIVVTKKVIR